METTDKKDKKKILGSHKLKNNGDSGKKETKAKNETFVNPNKEEETSGSPRSDDISIRKPSRPEDPNSSEKEVRKRKKRVQFKDFADIVEMPQLQGSDGSKVYKARWNRYRLPILLKELRGQEWIDKKADLEEKIRELRRDTHHPNILRVYGMVERATEEDRVLYLVTEFVTLGTLTRVLKQNLKLDERMRTKLLLEIAEGMCHIHNCRLLHKDLNTDNIYLDADYTVKITGFGFGPEVENPTLSAPEYQENKTWTKKSDVYVFGLLASQLFEDYKEEDKSKEPIYVKVVDPVPFPHLPDALRPIVQSCLDKDSTLRPTFSRIVDLLEDHYFTTWNPEDSEKAFHVVEELLTTLEEKEIQLKMREETIQKLVHKVKVLEEQLERITSGAQPLAQVARLPASKPSNVEGEIMEAFRGKLKIPWDEFQAAMCRSLHVDPELVGELKYLLADNESVDKSVWEYFLQWFCPLYDSPIPDTMVYLFQDIYSIVSPSWFFGFLSPVDTNKLLLKEKSGTFLCRFSSQPGSYTLSVSNQGQVGHWRIRSEKGIGYHFFYIDERRYDSLQHVIEVHLLEPLRVNSQKSNQQPILLQIPADRTGKMGGSESIYSEF